MNASTGNPWYENPLAVGLMLALVVVLVVLVWLIGVGAVFVDAAKSG